MKLVTELNENVRILTEAAEGGGKSYFIEGVFMQSDKENRNGRVYPEAVMMKEVNRYINESVVANRALGELGHPEGPTINLERVSHRIVELHQDGKDVCGKAKILDTPYGKIVKNFIDEGIKLGVSTRGLGSLARNDKGIMEVQDDFWLSTVDIVADPSAPGAFVNGIMEGKEWVCANGVFTAVDIDNYRRAVEKECSKVNPKLDETFVKLFKDFMRKL